MRCHTVWFCTATDRCQCRQEAGYRYILRLRRNRQIHIILSSLQHICPTRTILSTLTSNPNHKDMSTHQAISYSLSHRCSRIRGKLKVYHAFCGHLELRYFSQGARGTLVRASLPPFSRWKRNPFDSCTQRIYTRPMNCCR